MDFMNFLEIAHKKQKKHDKEVAKISELSELKKKEKIEGFARAEKIRSSVTSVEKMNRKFTGSDATPVVPMTEKNSHSNVVRPSKSSHIHSKPRNNSSLPDPIPIKQVDKVKQPEMSGKSSGNSVVNENIKSSVKQSNSIQNSNNSHKRPKLSFSDLIELAKKNVQDNAPKKNAFEDLIPCAPDSKYRRLDKSASVSEPSSSLMKNAVTGKQNSVKSLVRDKASVVDKKFCSSGAGTIRAASHASTNESPTLRNPSSKQTIPESRGSSRDFRNKPVILENNRLKIPSSDKESRIKHPNRTFPPKPERTVSGSHAKLKLPINHPKFPPSNLKSHKLVPTAQNFIPKRCGIAAQLGIKPPLNQKFDDSLSEDDDYESDDSFIDDSEVVESKTYAKVIRDVHKALRFNPQKYEEINPFDDLRSMEAKYCDIEKEEKRSARLGAQEDAVELEKDLERKRKKTLQTHKN